MNTSNAYTPENVMQAIEVLEHYIQSVLSEASDNQVDNTVNVQLKEITKTIERLEKQRIPVPESLLTERSNLLSLIVQPSTSTELVIEVYARLNAFLESISTVLKLRSNGDRAKSQRSKLPMIKHQIIRESIIMTLKSCKGSAERNAIIEHVGRQLQDKLLPGDLEWRDDWKCYVWQNRVGWELTDMRLAGILKPKSKTGIWELDDSYLGKS